MDINKLIAEVFVRPALWNQAHPDHHNRHILTKLWNEVSALLDLKRDVVQKKWKYLRDYFRVECTKILKLKSGDAGGSKIFVSSWPYYESMKFLLDQMTNRWSSGNLSQSSEPTCSQFKTENPVVIVEPENTENQNLEGTELEDEQEEQFNEATEIEEMQLGPERVEPRCNLPNRKRKSQSELIGDALISLENKKLEYLKSKNKTINERKIDEDRSFFDSLMTHVRMIPNNEKLLFRNEIQQVVQRFAYNQSWDATNSAAPTTNTLLDLEDTLK